MKHLGLIPIAILSLVALTMGCGGDDGEEAPEVPAPTTPAPNTGGGGGGGAGAPQLVAEGTMVLFNGGGGSSPDFSMPGAGHVTADVRWAVNTGQVTIYFIVDGQERGVAQSGSGDARIGTTAHVAQAGTGRLVIINGGTMPPSPQQFDYSVSFFPKWRRLQFATRPPRIERRGL